MSLADAIANFLRAPDGRPRREIEADIHDELQFHLAMAQNELERTGIPAGEARTQAMQQFGNIAQVEASCRRIQLGERSFLQRIAVGAAIAATLMIAFATLELYRNHVRQTTELTELRRSFAELQDRLVVVAAQTPPVVVSTVPKTGAMDVDPNAQEIRVTFSKEMMDQSWSWCQTEHPFPESVGPIRFEDNKTCVMPVKLEPATEYVLTINSEQHKNFKDPFGHPAQPYVLHFTTASIQ